MLSWPEDPFFDLRALQKSGIDDPYASGFLLPSDLLPSDIDLDTLINAKG